MVVEDELLWISFGFYTRICAAIWLRECCSRGELRFMTPVRSREPTIVCVLRESSLSPVREGNIY